VTLRTIETAPFAPCGLEKVSVCQCTQLLLLVVTAAVERERKDLDGCGAVSEDFSACALGVTVQVDQDVNLVAVDERRWKGARRRSTPHGEGHA